MTALVTLSNKLAERFGMESDNAEVLSVLKSTAFKGQVSDAQMTALLVVANQYGLNPWTKEIYAFPDKNNGIVPVVGVDGWARIINDHPQFDGMEFEQDAESCTCKMYRKDRTRPVAVTEYMAECKRNGVGPWQSHPKRMLRHKAMIQCARLAFGFTGIYEEDEAERIKDAAPKHMGRAVEVEAPPVTIPPGLLESAQEAAADGVASYQAFWQRITPDSRKALAAHHNALKAQAQEADAARTVEMPAAEGDDFVRDMEAAEARQ